MPILLSWDDEAQTVIRLDYADPVTTWQEYEDVVQMSYRWAQAARQRIDIIHVTGRVKMPPGSALPSLRRSAQAVPANVGLMVAIIDDPFARMIVPLVYKTLPNGGKLKYAHSLDQARTLIIGHRLKQAS